VVLHTNSGVHIGLAPLFTPGVAAAGAPTFGAGSAAAGVERVIVSGTPSAPHATAAPTSMDGPSASGYATAHDAVLVGNRVLGDAMQLAADSHWNLRELHDRLYPIAGPMVTSARIERVLVSDHSPIAAPHASAAPVVGPVVALQSDRGHSDHLSQDFQQALAADPSLDFQLWYNTYAMAMTGEDDAGEALGVDMGADTLLDPPAPWLFVGGALVGLVDSPPTKAFVWLRSAWPAILEYFLLLGACWAPRRLSSESDDSYLSRLGFWTDDTFADRGIGWLNCGDVGLAPEYLGGQTLQLNRALLDARLWRRLWRRAFRWVQHNAMGAHGLAWVALLDARSRVRDLWEDYSRQSRFNPGVEDAHRAWLRACRHASECHITLLRSRPSAAHHTPGLARHRRPQRRRRAH
jgi:hypothetical protein